MSVILYPPYRDFVCKAATCPRNCCAVFRIPFFLWEESRFETDPLWASFNGTCKSIRNSLVTDGRFWYMPRNRNGACTFWRCDGLCALQKEYGPDILPSVCRTYPRIITEFPDRTELSLDPCCPEVARSAKDWKIGTFEHSGGSGLIADPEYLLRGTALDILADETIPLEKAFMQLSDMYGAGLDVPGFNLEAQQALFLRKMSALMVFSILLPHKGHPKTENVMSFILETILDYISSRRGMMPDDWDSMSESFSTFLTDREIEIGCDDEIEGRYKDVKDIRG